MTDKTPSNGPKQQLKPIAKRLLGQSIIVATGIILAANFLRKIVFRSHPKFFGGRAVKLIYKHVYTCPGMDRFVALEVDTIELTLDKTKAIVKWLVFSNSGILRHSSIVDLTTRKILSFDGKRLPDHYFVLWAGENLNQGDRLMVYDRALRATSSIVRRYAMRRLDCWLVETEPGGIEQVGVIYDKRSLIEIEARSERGGEHAFNEIYSLVYDNISI